MYQDREGKKWWKGNLHAHTTKSDGKVSPKEAQRRYQEAGYDFLALTDHWYLSRSGHEKNMLLLSGIELDTMKNGCWHIVGIGLNRMPDAERGQSAQELIDAVREAGGFAILAHPAWSLEQPQDIAELEGLSGVEIYNSVSGFPYSSRADSSHVLDLAAKYGMRVPYIAADDTHFYQDELFKSYIYVQAEECSRKAILESIRAGRMYATQGPLIQKACIEGDRFVVECSPAEAVIFYSASVWQPDTVSRQPGITQAEFVLKPYDRFVRAQVIDKEGKSAWTSAYTVR